MVQDQSLDSCLMKIPSTALPLLHISRPPQTLGEVKLGEVVMNTIVLGDRCGHALDNLPRSASTELEKVASSCLNLPVQGKPTTAQ
jgi:hypothetical protein